MRFFGKTNIDFLANRNILYLVSAAFILAGFISIAMKGIPLGIDFSGGTELRVRFDQVTDIGDVRTSMSRAGITKAEIKSFGDNTTYLIRLPLEEQLDINPHDTTALQLASSAGSRINVALVNFFGQQEGAGKREFIIEKEDKIGPKIGKELRQDALLAVGASLLVILAYIAIRFKFIFGVGAVVALFHDVLFTIGLMSLLDGLVPGYRFEITQEVIAAFLTLVGVSVNDTVVVFDRIRENLKLFRSLPLAEVMKKSLNETLSRTIITSATLFFVLMVLLVFGGDVNRNFALALTIGIMVGTYSSIFIASAIVLEWTSRRLPGAEKRKVVTTTA